MDRILARVCSALTVSRVSPSNIAFTSVCSGQWAYPSGFAAFAKRDSDMIIVASPGGIYVSLANAEAITQVAERRNDFTKPTEVYRILEVWGPNVVTTEGNVWRRQRKVTAPAFSEKNNALVWEKSLEQIEGLIGLWSRAQGNTKNEMTIGNVHPDFADLSLHVISAAGFGIRFEFGDGEDQRSKTADVQSIFASQTPPEGHRLTFKKALQGILENFLWFAAFDPKTLSKWGQFLPLHAIKDISTSYKETSQYWEELVDKKVEMLRSGEAQGDKSDLLGKSLLSILHGKSAFS